MGETMLWGFILRFAQALISASPFILCGLFVAGAFHRLMGREATVRIFGGTSRSSLLRAWLIGMLLPVCSLGVIPVIRQMRKMGLKGGTILAFAMSAPLFNPLSVLYGLTLSQPTTIIVFCFCSLVVVTIIGLIWDRMFPANEQVGDAQPEVEYGIKRMLSVAVAAAREAGGLSAFYILIGLIGVGLLGASVPSGALQKAMNGGDTLAPLVMTGVAIPVYATPMLAMSQLGMMFQHANSPGAALVLLILGAGMNVGLVCWMVKQYGWKRSGAWFGLLLVVVVGLAYGVDRPLYPTDIDAADHTHAFDIYCRPFRSAPTNVAAFVMAKLERDTQPYERYAGLMLAAIFISGVLINSFDRQKRIESWLEQKQTYNAAKKVDFVIPGPVLGGIALLGLVAVSVVGCYAYYPPPEDALEELNLAKTETLAAALIGDETHCKYWIERYDDWTRKLEVGTYLRDWSLSDYHHIKTRILREQLELLEHEVEHHAHEADEEEHDHDHDHNHHDHEEDEIRHLIAQISRTHTRLRYAYLEER